MNRWVLFISALVAATVLAQPASPERPAAPPAVQPHPIVYVVQSGDWLLKIARTYGVGVEDIRKANNLTSDLITVGRKLIIPSPTAPAILSLPTAAVSQLTAENQQLRQQLNDVGAKLAAATAKAAELQPALTQAEGRLAATEAQWKALSAENAALQQQFAESEKRAEALAATAATNTNNAENVRQLEQQLAALQEKRAEADRQLAGRSIREFEGRMATLNEELVALRARLNVYETKAMPYTAEELALFRAPAATNAIAADSVPRRQVSLATAKLEATADRNLAAAELPQAEEKLLEVASQHDKEVRAFCNLAITQAAQERYAEAEQTIRKALALSPDDGASLAVFGHALRAQKRYEEALDALSRAASHKPDDAGIQTLLGITLVEKGMRGQAETAFRKALQISPNQVDAHRNLAIIYLTQQPPSIELARWHYRKSLAVGAPPSPELESRLAAATQTAAPK